VGAIACAIRWRAPWIGHAGCGDRGLGVTPLLVFGAKGQVAGELSKIGNALGFSPTLAGRETVDLLKDDGTALIARTRPAAVINAAAYTAVDRAELEPEQAARLNAEVPGALALACRAQHIPFIHISTDYVFDGQAFGFYDEQAPRNPLGVYGRTKADGERAVEAVGGRYAIVRTAWVYSAGGANFVRTMLRLATQRDEVGVVADQHGCPTWAEDVARGALLLCRSQLDGDTAAQGLFHLAGDGEATWADFAEAIFAESARRGGPSAKVRRITTADYPTPAQRPSNSRLDSTRLAQVLGWRPGPWRDSLAACFDEMNAAPEKTPSRS
jgi:dTDP-4-dehydrorhamnose reductase